MKDGRLIEAFLEMMSAERGAAENTLAAYRRDLEDISGFLSQRGIGLFSADTDLIRSYIQNISAQGFAPTSQARRLSSLRQFYRFLYAEGHRGDDPTAIKSSIDALAQATDDFAARRMDRSIRAALAGRRIDDLASVGRRAE